MRVLVLSRLLVSGMRESEVMLSRLALLVKYVVRQVSASRVSEGMLSRVALFHRGQESGQEVHFFKTGVFQKMKSWLVVIFVTYGLLEVVYQVFVQHRSMSRMFCMGPVRTYLFERRTVSNMN